MARFGRFGGRARLWRQRSDVAARGWRGDVARKLEETNDPRSTDVSHDGRVTGVTCVTLVSPFCVTFLCQRRVAYCVGRSIHMGILGVSKFDRDPQDSDFLDRAEGKETWKLQTE